MEMQVRFHSNHPPRTLRGDAAERLAFPDGKFATEIEHEGRRWTFLHTDLLKEPNDPEPRIERLVYRERK